MQIPRWKLSALILCVRSWSRRLPLFVNNMKTTNSLQRLFGVHLSFSGNLRSRSDCVMPSHTLGCIGRKNGLTEKHFYSKATSCKAVLGSPHSIRKYSEQADRRDDESPYHRPLKLMDFNEVMFPSVWKSIRNFWFSLLINRYYDDTFTAAGFVEGTTQAVAYVSSQISEGNFSSLHGLVEEEALAEIQTNYADLDEAQREFIAVNPSDLFIKFVYEIGMMFDDSSDQRFVEITVVFQGFHGFSKIRDMQANVDHQEVRDKLYVCNYRFIRDYTKGVSSDWIINKLNHFKPRDFTSS